MAVVVTFQDMQNTRVIPPSAQGLIEQTVWSEMCSDLKILEDLHTKVFRAAYCYTICISVCCICTCPYSIILCCAYPSAYNTAHATMLPT
jgi:hypothetical protein